MNINKVVLAGRLVRNVELRKTNNGTPVANFCVATNKKIRQGEEWVDKAAFVDVSMYGPRGERFTKHHARGDTCYLEGELETDQWNDKETGAPRSKLRMIANDWQFTGTYKSERGAEGGTDTQPSVDDTPF